MPGPYFHRGTMVDHIPYQRVNPREPLVFGDAQVLDVERLRKLWRPWLTLENSGQQHILAENATWLWQNANNYAPDHEYSRPWSGLTASSGLRTFILGQCRFGDSLGATGVEESSGFKSLNEVIEQWVNGSGLRKLQGVAVLNALTATAGFPSLAIPSLDSATPLEAHTAYEIARGLRARNPLDDTGSAVMHELAFNDVDRRLSLMAVVNLMTLLVRFQNDEDGARAYLDRAEQLRLDLSSQSTWLDWHIVNNFHRIKALLEARSGSQELAEEELTAASVADYNAAVAAGDDDYARHITRQGHMLLTGVKVRFETRKHGRPRDVRREIKDLNLLGPFDFEQQPAIGDLFVSRGEVSAAIEHYRAGAQGGAVQGATAAFRAFECNVQLGRQSEAEEDLLLLRDLDPGADLGVYECSR